MKDGPSVLSVGDVMRAMSFSPVKGTSVCERVCLCVRVCFECVSGCTFLIKLDAESETDKI